MYRYDEFDHRFVAERTAQFREQALRRLSGELSEDEFRPLRLMNGLYLQLHAYMLRIAIPYGTLSSRQLDRLADIAERYDRGYGHFTTRQNIQFNWIKLEDTADILESLAEVEMHAIQTSGNCIRNVTTDHWAGAAADELADPRPVAELLRQWSSLNPEFSYLPRKFKIAVTGAPNDRAAVKVHDIGLQDASRCFGSTRLGGHRRRRPGAHPGGRHHRPRLPARAPAAALSRSHHARLQSAWPARQQIQGAHQDPGHGARREALPRGGRGRVRPDHPSDRRGRRQGARADLGLFRAALLRDTAQDLGRLRAGEARQCRLRQMGARQSRRPPGRRLRHRQHLAQAARAASPAMPPPSRCGSSPISPVATVSTRCG